MPLGDPLSVFRPWAVPRMSGTPSKGMYLRNLEGLIRAAREELRAFSEGRTSYIGYITNLKGHMQHCLADIGEAAQEELRELAAMDLNLSDELATWYAKGVHNDFQVKEGDDPADFLRAQAEYDQSMPPRLQRMIDLLERVRDKMLGIGLEPRPSAPAQPAPSPRPASPLRDVDPEGLRKPYSKRDHTLYELIGREDLARFTDAELWKRKAKDFRKMQPPGKRATPNAFRTRLFRIRKHHGIPAPKP